MTQASTRRARTSAWPFFISAAANAIAAAVSLAIGNGTVVAFAGVAAALSLVAGVVQLRAR